MDKVYTYKEETNNSNKAQYVVEKKKPKVFKTALVIFLIIAIIVGGVSLIGFDNILKQLGIGPMEEYIATIYVRDEISETASGFYDHNYILNTIDDLENDENNKGIILWVDTPGGTVYASDELYLKLKEYKEKTGRPIYSSYQSMAASGGYYISCLSDKIYANRNCWTGSIGVTMGSYIDVTGLLEKLGIKINTITSGRNKAMGSELVEMTDEQKEILQSLVDETYENFVSIVSEGRNIEINKVKEIADGRVYTATQALEIGLVDEVGTYEDCVNGIKEVVGDIEVYEYKTVPKNVDLLSLFSTTDADNKGTTLSEIEELLSMNGQFKISYMSTITK